MANLVPVENEEDVKDDKCFDDKQTMPDHLRDLYERTIKGMRYSKLFAVSDAELGKTNVTELKIDTGSAQPIKQRPRRLPFHMQT